MPEEVKFNEEELKQVQEIQNNYITIQNQFGQLKLAELKLNSDEVILNNALQQIQEKEKEFLDNITKKYGQGTLNPETGVFTPVETTENKSE